jgi:hypothetical protein
VLSYGLTGLSISIVDVGCHSVVLEGENIKRVVTLFSNLLVVLSLKLLVILWSSIQLSLSLYHQVLPSAALTQGINVLED